ncbi:MAG TPA: RDD family protein [Povalibacter sp.]
MNIAASFLTIPRARLPWRPLLGAALCLLSLLAVAQETPPPPAPAVEPEMQVEPATPDATTQVEAPEEAVEDSFDDDDDHGHHGTTLRFNTDTTIGPDEVLDAVVTIGGSTTSAGHVLEAVVSVFGNTHVTGPVGDAAVAVIGSTYVNSRVDGDVVAILGDVTLGPEARVGGEVVVVSGDLIRDPAAVVKGDIQQVGLPTDFGRFEWLRPWVKHCLFLGRPLAMEPGLGWAWTLALGFLALYIVLALMFSDSVTRCVQTLETQPGRTLVTSLLTVVLTPVLTILLAVTVVGAVLVPFVWMGLLLAGLFGKAVILAALGRRVTRVFGDGPLSDIAFAVVFGGIIVLGLYMVPVLGFITYKVLGILGLGVVIYTLLLTAQARRDSVRAIPQPATAAAPLATGAVTERAIEPGTAEPVDPAATDGTATPAPTGTAAVADVALPRAGFWIRMGALLIDVVLIGVALAVVQPENVFLLALGVYGAVMWKLKGTTVGGIVCNLKVVRLDGREIDWSTAAVRALSCFLSLAALGLGFMWIGFDRGRQAWHDKIAGTAVVRVPQGVSLL